MTKSLLDRLVERVPKAKLALAKTLKSVVSKSILALVGDTIIDQFDNFIRMLAERDLHQATGLAVRNCRVARCRGSDRVQGNCHTTLGWLYQQQEELDLALYHYQQTVNVFETIPESQARRIVARIRFDMGRIREHQSHFETAIEAYREALALALQLQQPQLATDVQNSLGGVHLTLGQADDACLAFQNALELSRANDDPRGEETALGNLGLTNHFLGRLTEASDHHRQALVISRKIDHQAGTGRHLSHLGNVLLELDELREAEMYFLEALDIARQRHDRRGEQQRLGNLGNLYQARAQQETDQRRSESWLAEAEQHHQKALAIARERDDRRSQSDHLTNLGNVYSRLKHLEAALRCYAEALSLAEEEDAVDTQWRVHYAWGNLCAAQRQDQQAFSHYEDSINIVESQRSRLKIESRMKFWQERATLYKRMVLCCLHLSELWPALEYTERAKARYLADLLAERSPERDDTVEPMDDTLKTIEDVIEDLPTSTAVVIFNVTEAGTVLFIVTNRLEDAADDGWRKSPDGRIRVKLVKEFDRDTLQRILVKVDDSGEAGGGYLVDYYADRAQWRKSTLESVSAEIYKSLLDSGHRELTRLSVERVVFMPNLGLSLLPLHACYKLNGTKRDYLLDHYEIAYAPSFGVLRHCQMRARSELPDDLNLFAVANPTDDLVWADVEVERVARLFSKAKILSHGREDRATPEAVISGASKHAFVHFSCHGQFNLREPLQSALSLARPDSLTLKVVLMGDAPEIDQTAVEALGPLKLPRTRMVVMSACETGLVDPGDLADEYVSLPAGFLLAGAPAVVSTLWAVDDLSTALLIQRFYEYHLQEALPPAMALRRAQVWLRDELTLADIERQQQAYEKEGKWFLWGKLEENKRRLLEEHNNDNSARPFAHPYYWAAFTVTGV